MLEGVLVQVLIQVVEGMVITMAIAVMAELTIVKKSQIWNVKVLHEVSVQITKLMEELGRMKTTINTK